MKKQSTFDHIEETLIAVLLGLMTLITFANVVARYVFDSNILWALQATVFLFAWLVLIGASYCVKITAHLGVDVILNIVSPKMRKFFAVLAVISCVVFTGLLLKGSWDYWWPFASKNAWYETDDIPMIDFLRFIEPWLNEGEEYEKLPRFIPYAALPIGMALLLYRFLEAGWKVYRGEADMIIASHEAEDMVEEAALTAEKD